MDIVPILSTVILIATLATLILAVGSYLAFKLRDQRRPKAVARGTAEPEKTFFVRYRPPRDTARGSTP